MTSNDFTLFCLQVAVMLGAAFLCGRFARRMGQPMILGELAAGILLGPTLFGAIAPGVYAGFFPDSGAVAIARDGLTKLGMLFFLFIAGLEMNLGRIRRQSRPAFLTSVTGIAVPFALGVLLVRAFPGYWLPRIHTEISVFALFLGIALSISALPVISRILMDLGLMRHPVGEVVVTAAVVDDLVGWSVFAIVIGSVHSHRLLPLDSLLPMFGGFAAFVVLVLLLGGVLGRRYLPRLVHRRDLSGALLVSLVIIMLVASAVTEAIGIHAIFGAFLVGVALDFDPVERNHTHEIMYRFAVNFFAPLYFVSIGLKANFVTDFNTPLVLLILLVATVGKVAGAGIGARAGGLKPREALAVGCGMNARGVMEIILASVALEYALIGKEIYVALVVMALVSSMASGPLMKALLRSPAGVARG